LKPARIQLMQAYFSMQTADQEIAYCSSKVFAMLVYLITRVPVALPTLQI